MCLLYPVSIMYNILHLNQYGTYDYMRLNSFLKKMLHPDTNNAIHDDFGKVKHYSKKTEFIPQVSSHDTAIYFLLWPMTTFNVVSHLLDTYDAYQYIVSHAGKNGIKRNMQREARRMGARWSFYLKRSLKYKLLPVPKDIHTMLFQVFKNSNSAKGLELPNLVQDDAFMANVMTLLIASDECANRLKNLPPNNNLNDYYSDILNFNQTESVKSLSQCERVHGSVHYKTMTPQAGISLNSLSHYLAYVKPGIDCHYIRGANKNSSNLYNILILPWPLRINNDFFIHDKNPPLGMDHEHFGFFSYENKHKITTEMICYAIDNCEEDAYFPDLVVIPECAIERSDSSVLVDEIKQYYFGKNKKAPVMIFGVFSTSTENCFGENNLDLSYESKNDDYLTESQEKHHRWALDSNQIINYKLGAVLSSNKKWWESCQIGSRKIISYHDNHIQICPLICEDLARQDPIAPVVRSLGPSLVVALLLDGPQIKGRWPERYATVLSEDPGSSVLSISPYGMTQRSDGSGHNPSSNVALWSDGDNTKSLELQKNKVGICLTLNKFDLIQWSADGRRLKKESLKYAGYTCIGKRSESNLFSL